MSNLRQAAEQALEALENHTAIKHPQQIHYRDSAIEALRAALKNEFGSDWDAMAVMVAERQRIVNLLMIQHEAAKGAHNYWHVAAQLIQADVASDT